MLAVEGLDLQHLRLSYSYDRGTEWTKSMRIPIPQQGIALPRTRGKDFVPYCLTLVSLPPHRIPCIPQ